MHLKQLRKYAGIETSVVRPYPKGDEEGWPGWQFNVPGEPRYEGATEEPIFGFKHLHELYFKADEDYTGRYSVPLLWDKELNTIVNSESAELMRDLQTAFDSILPADLQRINLYPQDLQVDIDRVEQWMQRDLNRGVYKVGFATNQYAYNNNLPPVFAALNALESLAHDKGGPYILGDRMTELDVRAYATLVRFDAIYVQHFKCNLAMIRHGYPTLNNWLKNLYWNHAAFRETTDFRHIKESYTKSHHEINPTGITPMGPWPDVEQHYQSDWSVIKVGKVEMPEVLEHQVELDLDPL